MHMYCNLCTHSCTHSSLDLRPNSPKSQVSAHELASVEAAPGAVLDADDEAFAASAAAGALMSGAGAGGGAGGGDNDANDDNDGEPFDADAELYG